MESYFENPGALESVSSSVKLLQNDITGETAFSVSIHRFQLRIGIRGSDPLPVLTIVLAGPWVCILCVVRCAGDRLDEKTVS